MMRKFIACLSIITVFITLITTSTIHGQGIEWQCPEIIQRDKIAKPSEALYFILSYADGRNELWYSDGTVLYSKVYEFRFSGEANSVYAKISPDKSKLALTLVKTDGDPRFVEGDVEVKVITLNNFKTTIYRFKVGRNYIDIPNFYPYSLSWGWVNAEIIAYNLNTIRLSIDTQNGEVTQTNWTQLNRNQDKRLNIEPGSGPYVYYTQQTSENSINILQIYDVVLKRFLTQNFQYKSTGYLLSFSENGRQIATLDGSGALSLIDPALGKMRRVVQNGWVEYNLLGYLNPSQNLLSVMWHTNDQFSLKSRMYAISLPSDPSTYIARFKPLCLNGFMNYYAGFPSWLGDEYYQFLMNIDDKPQWYIYHAPTHTLTDVMPSELLQEFREANTRLTVAGWGQFPAK